MSAETADRLAAAVLDACGISPEPPLPLGQLAKALGVAEIREERMVEDGRLEQNDGRTVIFIRQEVGRARQRFTLGHELGHLVLADPDRDFVAHRAPVPFDSEERFCDRFAAALLLPRYWVRRDFAAQPQSLEVLRDLGQRAETSLAASLVRLREVLNWQGSLLHWGRLGGQWRLRSAAGLPRKIQNSVESDADTRVVLSKLAGTEEVRRGRLPLRIDGVPFAVPVEISVRRDSAIALAAFNDPAFSRR